MKRKQKTVIDLLPLLLVTAFAFLAVSLKFYQSNPNFLSNILGARIEQPTSRTTVTTEATPPLRPTATPTPITRDQGARFFQTISPTQPPVVEPTNISIFPTVFPTLIPTITAEPSPLIYPSTNFLQPNIYLEIARINAGLDKNSTRFTDQNDTTVFVSGLKKTKLFGFIPIKIKIVVALDKNDDSKITIKKPWWSFLTVEEKINDLGFVCGNKVCEPGEKPSNCREDCCGSCGDGKCLGYTCEEDKETSQYFCPADCKKNICGNAVCEKGETLEKCPADCKTNSCGDGVCWGNEGPDTCPIDCATACGNNVCEKGENFRSCPVDCGFCGDGICKFDEMESGENPCSADCPTTCGNLNCEETENKNNCPYDCPNK